MRGFSFSLVIFFLIFGTFNLAFGTEATLESGVARGLGRVDSKDSKNTESKQNLDSNLESKNENLEQKQGHEYERDVSAFSQKPQHDGELQNLDSKDSKNKTAESTKKDYKDSKNTIETAQNTDTATESNITKTAQKEPRFPLLNKEKKQELFHTQYLDASAVQVAPKPLQMTSILPLEEWRGTYAIYLYNFAPIVNDSPFQDKLWPNELKMQISFRVPLVRNIFKSGGIFYFAMTDTFYFQLFNEKASSPVRDNDLQPEFLYTYPMNVEFWGGALTEVTTGWRHISNGETGLRSRGSDRWILKAIWQSKHFGVDIETYFPLRYYEENPNIYRFITGIDLKLFFRHKNHLADATINGMLSRAGFKAKTGILGLRLSYTYKVSSYFGLYVQYFVGLNDTLIEYNRFGHRLGAGVRFVR